MNRIILLYKIVIDFFKSKHSGNEYRAATLSKLYLKDNDSNMPTLTIRANRYILSLIIEKKLRFYSVNHNFWHSYIPYHCTGKNSACCVLQK